MRELVLRSDCFDVMDEDNPEFHHAVVIWKEDKEYYHVEHPERNFDLDKLSAKPIPRNHYRFMWYEGLTVALNPSFPDYYIKTPSLRSYCGTSIISEMLLAEIQIMERLQTTPHPNVCTYYGCVLEGTFVIGLCLKRYQRTLDEAMEDANYRIDQTKVINGIRSGLDFIHSLGLAHNDLNPRNIMLDDDGTPVIIDFDSCAQEGAKLQKGGTPDWSEETELSAKSNDDDAFNLIQRFIRREYLPDQL